VDRNPSGSKSFRKTTLAPAASALLNRPGTADVFDDIAAWFANPNVVACDARITDRDVADLGTT
jgi:hypothetical protein